MNMSACIYIIHSTLNPEKYYVGSAINFNKRKSVHIWDLKKKNKHHCEHFQRAIKKYGINTFKFYILEYVKDLSKLLDREDYYLQDFFWFDDELYNSCYVAGSRLFCKNPHNNEWKSKISLSLKGNINALGTKRPDVSKNNSQRMIGNTFRKGKTPWNKGNRGSYKKLISNCNIG